MFQIKENTKKWVALFWITLSVMFALSLWFSASTVVAHLKVTSNLNHIFTAFLTASVSCGFVIGALISAYFGIADRYNARKLFAISASLGALFNGLLIFTDTAILAVILSLLTGVTLAGIYPVAVKILSQWFPNRRGLAIGVLIGALALGSSMPHMIALFFASFNWKLIVLCSSILAISSACIIHWVLDDEPGTLKKATFSFKFLKEVTSNKQVMLANYGYFGHMWELYAMWTWIPIFLAASYSSFSPDINPSISILSSFISIGIAGFIGCILGGFLSEKIGKSQVTIISMSISACCAILIGFTFGHSIWLPFLLSVVWGIFVIADSAQFSASVTEFSDVEYVGTALTFQMCIGFLITIFSINIVPILQLYIGWEWVFIVLCIGPIMGIFSMHKLKEYELSKE